MTMFEELFALAASATLTMTLNMISSIRLLPR